ncbi:hypothetical protein KQ51_00094 [Candidatus Izimaplasma bacterium HR1]|jgi:hypothetical protein|uniref:DUF1801 domain-containing protein n=1 Tax=Candidatus Izimoplasma sp. HR1 TaxID=1541959 RepID=UPI0004F5E56A|nr:hypothetical protein KQ51_00094 [Candidatus Izimaplasma bacterium HR1]
MSDITSRINEVESTKRKKDTHAIFELIKENVPDEPRLWEDTWIGFGDFHYVNKTNEGDMCILGLVAAKAHVTMYFTVGGLDPYKSYLDRLGKYRRGKTCLYISNFDKVDKVVLGDLIKTYYQDVIDGKASYGGYR